MELVFLALLATTGLATPTASPGPVGGWAVTKYVTMAGPTLAFWGPLGFRDEVHESDWVVSWRVGSEFAGLLRRQDAPCLVPGVVSVAIGLGSFCDRLGNLEKIEGRYRLYPGRDGVTFLETKTENGLRTTLLRLDGKNWIPLEQAEHLASAPFLSMSSGVPTLGRPAGLSSDERAFARDTDGSVLFGSKEGDLFLARPNGERQRIVLRIPEERVGYWDRISDDARPWSPQVVLTRRLASGSLEMAAVSLATGELSLQEVVRPPTAGWKWTSVIRTGDGKLLALSEIGTANTVPIRFFFKEVGSPDAVVREVRVSPVAR